MNLQHRKPDLSYLLKTFWFGLISLLVGPFALWFILDGKLRRRGLLPGYSGRFLASVCLFIAFHGLLFLAPVHWTGLVALYLTACAATTWALSRPDRASLFRLPSDGRTDSGPRFPFRESLLTASLALLPLVYIVSLVHNIGDLGTFSIRLPSDVYTDGARWMAYAVPGVFLLAWLGWKTSYRPGLRALIFFYAGVAVVLFWIMVWERLDQAALAAFDLEDRDPMLFRFDAEQAWRLSVKWIFYGAAFLLGIAYLVGAARTAVFAKRALLLGLPSMLLYGNMLFFLGDWNLYLGAFREGAYALHHYGAYRYAAMAQLARTPDAYWATPLREEWADLEYQAGDLPRAKALFAEVAEEGRRNAWHARLGRRAEVTLANLERPGGESVLLDLPVIKPASYLDREWYALLGAVAFLRPDWTDLDLRKRLLDLSSTVQLNLPRLDNLPELAPVFRQLGIPVSPCFLTRERAIAALRAGRIPFLSLHGRWVPLSGYDSGRDGFYYRSYRDRRGGSGMFRNEDTDLFSHKPGERFGTRAGQARPPRYSLQKFIPAGELMKHVLDIGGVAVILGDSAFAPENERRAAYLVEQGDVHYQDHDNYEGAAACYREAAALLPHDQVLSRMLYLKRRYREAASDPRDYRNLFREFPPGWMSSLGPGGAEEKALLDRILAGKLGSYVLMNWNEPAPPDTSARSRAALDSSRRLFSVLRELDPFEPLFVDSLATLARRAGDLAASESLFTLLAGMQPFGNEHTLFRLAWVRLELGRHGDLEEVLEGCRAYAEDPRHLAMQGAAALHRGQERKAWRALSKSLKLDKGLGETHALLAEYHRRRGEAAAEAAHRLWLKRST